MQAQLPPTQVEAKFASLVMYKAKPGSRNCPPLHWMSEQTWQAFGFLANVQRGRENQEAEQAAHEVVQVSVNFDRRQRLVNTSKLVEQAMENHDVHGAYQILQRWYKASTGKVPKPSRADLDTVHAKFTALYTEQPIGLPFTSHDDSARNLVDDTIPGADEIAEACKKLRLLAAPGPSGLTAFDLRRFLFNSEEGKEVERWKEVVSVVQQDFNGQLPVQLQWSALVLLPKPDGGVRGIGLLEVMWKLITKVIQFGH
jgi:hypothetical protein